MAASYLSLDALMPAFTTGALVLVPNNRLRNHLLRAYALQQTRLAWIKPNIQTLSQWLDSQWQQLQMNGYEAACAQIATPLQRQMLWEAIIKNSPLGSRLLQPKPLAQQADTAYKNLQLWCAENSLETDYFLDSLSNSGQFLQWMKVFTHQLSSQKSITRESSYRLIAEAFIRGQLTPLPQIYLEGFDDLPPLMEQVLAAATETVIRQSNQSAINPRLFRTIATGFEDEIRAAAQWSKQQFSANPEHALIGIVVPNLGQCRLQVERIFSEIFEPHAWDISTARYTLPFNFSAGTPLGSTPLIESLFLLLRLQEPEWPLADICQLLNSPFWGDSDNEALVRAHTIHELQRLRRMTITTSDVRFCINKLTTRQPEFANSELNHRFETIGNLLRRRFDTKPASEWLHIFDEILQTMSWPGSRRLDSQEYQQMNQWNALRDEFVRLDSHSGPFSYQQACRYLRELADTTPFQPQTPDSPIQILGALEAAGLQFSHLWVMGLNDNQWPPVPSPNPLLPLGLQRQLKMPHASAERELEIAQGLTARYRQSAPLIIFSSAHSNGDSELRPSALIREIPLTPLAQLVQENSDDLQAYYQRLLSDHNSLETLIDEYGPRLAADETVRGGSSLFKLQASCPFEAFVRLRLGATSPDEPTLGFSAAERGNLLHDTLAGVWQQLKNSRALQTMSDENLAQLLEQITQEIIAHAKSRNPRQLGSVYCQLEQARLKTLLLEWLIGERERPDFQVIAIEEEQQVHFAGLNLRLRIDRIDEFQNGDRLLIDYKTGNNTSSKQWLNERLSEPQLPLYAITAPDKQTIAAISFAIINRKQQTWDGLGELHDHSLQQAGIKPSDDWQAQLMQWQVRLQQLANDFINGDAKIDFVDATAESYAADLIPLHRLPDAEAVNNFIQKAPMPNKDIDL